MNLQDFFQLIVTRQPHLTPPRLLNFSNSTLPLVYGLNQNMTDIMVGLINRGIWPESPSFKDDGMTPILAKWKGIFEEGEDFNSSM